jgi:hypothetical protein
MANDLRCGCAHGDGQRFVVHADERLTTFVEVESGIRTCEK